jgi:hypothetical protein
MDDEDEPTPRPAFVGDDFDALRREQNWNAPRAAIVDQVTRNYLRAAAAAGRENDAVAVALRDGRSNPRAIAIVHHHLAAWWRLVHGHLQAPVEAEAGRASDLATAWRTWARDTVTLWIFDAPQLLRHAAAALTRARGPEALAAERTLADELQALPPPSHPDLFEQ